MRLRLRAPLCTLSLALAASAMSLTGCGGHETFVKTDSALGRVVVYRNGIAYYERRARRIGDQLVLTVPQDKVDDFLKSLTVTDAASGETVPVSYPTSGASQGGQVDMTLQLPPGTGDELVITYITDAPAWKPSYRLVVGDEGQVDVQGWAIVDNTTGEDWTQVKVGVGASSALSFRYDLRSVVHVHRETLGGQKSFAVAPPTGGAVHGGAKASKDGAVALALGDDLLSAARAGEAAPESIVVARAEAVEEVALDKEDDGIDDLMADVGSSGGSPRPARRTRGAAKKPTDSRRARAQREQLRREAELRAKQAQRTQRAQQADNRISGLANRLVQSGETVVIEAYRAQHQNDAAASEQAHFVRNRLIELGVAPGRVQVQSKGHVAGQPAGVQMRLVSAAQVAEANADPVGESHFESDAPMTIPRGTSAMVAVLDEDTAGEVVYVYNPDGERGDGRFAFKAVRFQNPTESTLEAGPVTVYGAQRFIGEGLTDSIPPKSTALIPFALDRQVAIEQNAETRESIAKVVGVDRGSFTAELRHTRRTTYTVSNRGKTPATVFLRHTVGDGWTLGEAPELFERQGEAHLFAVQVGPDASETVSIEAWTPMQRTLDLRAGAGVDLLRRWLDTGPTDKRFVDAVRTLLGIHDQIVAHHTRINSTRAQLAELRQRSAELTHQIERLDGTAGGRALKSHLQKKLIEVSERIQKATVDTVTVQEALMLARIRFQDAATELTLERPASEQVSRR